MHSSPLFFSFFFSVLFLAFLFCKMFGPKLTFVKYEVVPFNYFAISGTAIKRFGGLMISFEFGLNEKGLNRAVLGTVLVARFNLEIQIMLILFL